MDIWLPPGYDELNDTRYPVLYMHDGQNLFDTATAYGGVTWAVDEALVSLAQAGQVRAAIIVGVWHSGQRWREYMPQKLLDLPEGQALRQRFIQEQGGTPAGDGYQRFLVEELKPLIDHDFHTLPGQNDTFIMGSSMGGLASLYALEQSPEIFGGAGCLSTHWPAGGELLVDFMAESLPPPGAHRLYFDFGTETLDALYEPFQQRMDEALRRRGWVEGQYWVTHKFPGAVHNEAAWRARVHLPLEFLLGK